jgi:hypothetical protein
MAVYTDLLVADASDAEAILAAEAHHTQWPCWQTKGLDPGNLAILLSVLSSEPYQDTFVDEFTVVAEEETESGPWVYQIPNRLVEHLAATQDEQVEQAARRWAEEMGVPLYMIERANAPVGTGLMAKLFGRARTAAAAAELERYRAQRVESNQSMLKQLRSMAGEAKSCDKQLLLWIAV